MTYHQISIKERMREDHAPIMGTCLLKKWKPVWTEHKK